MGRVLRHLVHGPVSVKRKFSPRVLDSIEQTVRASEKKHGGEIRFVVEASLPWRAVVSGRSPRQRAMDLFAQCGVWDTEDNNGVMIYVNMADRDVEIVADRGLNSKITSGEWEQVCRLMERYYREGNFTQGSIAGVEGVGELLARHFPPSTSLRSNELPDTPTLL